MKLRLAYGLLSACLVCGCASDRPIVTLIESERSFAALSLARDSRTAFLSFLDDSAVIFRPHPVNGKEWIGRQQSRPTVLAWEPAFAGCSADGDLGYTTGPWKFSRSSSSPEFISFGYFVTVWGRRPGGVWKVLLDIGTSNPKPASDVEPLEAETLLRLNGAGEPLPLPGLFLEAEKQFGRIVQRTGVDSAYRAVSAEGCRFYREGHLPAVGYESARRVIDRTSGVPVLTLLALHEAASADLAYAYGHYEFPRGAEPGESGYYLHIWRHSQKGPRLVLDLLSPVPRQ